VEALLEVRNRVAHGGLYPQERPPELSAATVLALARAAGCMFALLARGAGAGSVPARAQQALAALGEQAARHTASKQRRTRAAAALARAPLSAAAASYPALPSLQLQAAQERELVGAATAAAIAASPRQQPRAAIDELAISRAQVAALLGAARGAAAEKAELQREKEALQLELLLLRVRAEELEKQLAQGEGQ
jgi:hypothetical protein